jgi:hypothetical protein
MTLTLCGIEAASLFCFRDAVLFAKEGGDGQEGSMIGPKICNISDPRADLIFN